MLQAHNGPPLRGALAGPHVTAVVAHGNDDTVRAHGAPLLLIAGSPEQRAVEPLAEPGCQRKEPPRPAMGRGVPGDLRPQRDLLLGGACRSAPSGTAGQVWSARAPPNWRAGA